MNHTEPLWLALLLKKKKKVFALHTHDFDCELTIETELKYLKIILTSLRKNH